MAKLDELQTRLAAANERAQAIQQKADDESRDLSAEEEQEMDACLATYDKLAADIGRLEKLNQTTEHLHAGLGRKTESDAPMHTVDIGDGHPVTERRLAPGQSKLPAYPIAQVPGNWRFNSMGDFALSVRRFCTREGGIDPRLEYSQKLAAASTYGVESVGADGGFAVPPDFRNAIMQKVTGEESLLSRCDQVTVTGNSFTCPKDETTPWQTSGGILAYWDGEASTATQSKPLLEATTIKLNKLRALVPVTEELLEDASAMDAYLRRKAPEKIGFKVNLAILQGTGVGQPLGILNSGALVTISKEGSQVADTLVGNNIIKMYAAMPSVNKTNAVWLINPDLVPMLMKLSVPGTDNTGNAVTGWGALLYMPPGGLSVGPYGTLLGKPVIETQACETLGDLGDIFFVDLTAYLALIKGGTNPRVETSMHLWFDQDLVAFKFVLRVGGQPWWSSSIAARDGNATYSPYVTLESR